MYVVNISIVQKEPFTVNIPGLGLLVHVPCQLAGNWTGTQPVHL